MFGTTNLLLPITGSLIAFFAASNVVVAGSVLQPVELVPSTLLWFYYDLYEKRSTAINTASTTSSIAKTTLPSPSAAAEQQTTFNECSSITEDEPICDPESILHDAERLRLVDAIRNLRSETENMFEGGFCNRQGISAFLMLSKRPTVDNVGLEDPNAANLLKRWSPDRLCLKSLLFLIPVEQPEHMKIVTFTEVPLTASEIRTLLDSEISHLHRSHYFDAFSALIRNTRHLIRSKQSSSSSSITAWSPGLTSTMLNPPITWLQFVLISISAVVFAVLVLFLAISMFFYCSMMRQCLKSDEESFTEEMRSPPVYYINEGRRDSVETELETIYSIK